LLLLLDLEDPRRTHFTGHEGGNVIAIDAVVHWCDSSALNDDIDIGGLTTRSFRLEQGFDCKACLRRVSKSGLISIGHAPGHSCRARAPYINGTLDHYIVDVAFAFEFHFDARAVIATF